MNCLLFSQLWGGEQSASDEVTQWGKGGNGLERSLIMNYFLWWQCMKYLTKGVYIKSLKNKSTKARLNLDHGNVWSLYPPIAGKIKRFWWFPISVKAILLKLGDRCFLPLANFGLFLWRWERERSGEWPAQVTPLALPHHHPPTKKHFLRQIKCYFTPHPPPNKKKSSEWSSWVAPPVSPHNPPDHFCERFSNSDCSY